jgi:hypothetical protein
MENADPERIVVNESCCRACKVHSFLVHHQTFPEMRMEAMSADRAARQLANRLEAALGMVSDPHHRQEIRLAIDDARAFIDREGSCAHSRCDAQGHHPS